MKKKRFLKIICCFCLLLCSTFFLAACGKNPVDGYESGSDAPAPDNTPPSTGDDSDVDINDDGNIKSGEVADFSQYFSGYIVTINESGDIKIKDDVSGKEVEFSTLVDRQIDVLAQDILNGLNYIYGNVRINQTEIVDGNVVSVWGKSYPMTPSYKISDENFARTDTSKILKTLDNFSAELKVINIDSLEDYQNSLVISDNGKNYLAYEVILSLIGASNGSSMKIDYTDDFKALRTDESKKWNIVDLDPIKFKDTTKNNLKFWIAQELTENSSDNYDTLIKNINTLGYTSNFSEKLINIINNKIIGIDRINEDNGYYDIIKNKYESKITFNNVTSINADPDYTESNSPRLYKGYKVVIPALVKRALRNTFEGDYQPKAMKNWKAKDKDGKEISYWGEDTSNWASTSLYPYFKKSSSDNGNFSTYPIIKDGEVIQEMTTTGPKKIDKIILQPKANTQPVALQLQIATARDKHTGRTPTGIDDVTCYEHDIVVELEVDIMYKAGTYKKEMNSYVPDGESSSVLTIDSRGYVPTYIDTKDPNFDPSKVQFDPNNPNAKDPYSESFRKPYDTNGEVLPFNYIFSIYDKFDKDPATPKFGEYDGPTSINDMGTIVGNNYECTDGVNINLDTGNNYLQFTFRIKSIKQYSGDNDSELVDTNFKASDVVFDISLMPYTF